MAASTAFVAGSAMVAAPVSMDLSSCKAFGSGTSTLVHATPVSRAHVSKAVAVRASSNSEESRPARREVLASFLAAGAALNFNSQAFAANPVETAKSKAGQAVQGAKDLAGSNPLDNISNPLDNVGNPLGEAQKVAEDVGYELKGQIDGIFKKAPRKFKKPTTTGNGAIADAKARVNNFLNKSQNPIATNVEKAAKETEAGLGSATGPNSASARANRELLGQDSTRVDEATKKVGALQNKLTNKALQAVDDVKNAAGQVQNAAPDVPTPSAPGLFKNLGSKIQGAKGDIASKAEEAKNAASNVTGLQ